MMPTHPSHEANTTRSSLVLGDEEIEVMPGVFLSKPSRAAASNSNTMTSTSKHRQGESSAQPHWTQAYATALNELPSDTLVAEFKALGNSRDHLVRSNQELQEFAHQESDPAERQQLLDIIQENVALLPTFKVKQSLVATALQKRGVDLAHTLGIALVDAAVTSTPATEQRQGPPSSRAESRGGVAQPTSSSAELEQQPDQGEEEEGVFL